MTPEDVTATPNANLRADLQRMTELAEKRQDTIDMMTGQLQEARKHSSAADLQLSEEKKLSTLWMERADENEQAAIVLRIQKYEAAADYLEAEAKKIPLGEGNAQRGFSSTYNALAFAVEVLRAACGVKYIPTADTCANYRDGNRIVKSVFCSEFDATSKHSPTCQFAVKRIEPVQNCQRCEHLERGASCSKCVDALERERDRYKTALAWFETKCDPNEVGPVIRDLVRDVLRG